MTYQTVSRPSAFAAIRSRFLRTFAISLIHTTVQRRRTPPPIFRQRALHARCRARKRVGAVCAFRGSHLPPPASTYRVYDVSSSHILPCKGSAFLPCSPKRRLHEFSCTVRALLAPCSLLARASAYILALGISVVFEHLRLVESEIV